VRFLEELCGREISRCIFHVHVPSEILGRIVRKRDIELYISRSRSSGGIRKEQKEVFIDSLVLQSGCMQNIDSFVLQSAVRPQVATTYRSVPIKSALCYLSYWGAT